MHDTTEEETIVWHRITLFLTWASVVCHRELYHCGQPGVGNNLSCPSSPRLPFTLLHFSLGEHRLFFFFYSWVLQKWFSVIALPQMRNGWMIGRLVRGEWQWPCPSLYVAMQTQIHSVDAYDQGHCLVIIERQTDGWVDGWTNRQTDRDENSMAIQWYVLSLVDNDF